MLSRDLTGAAPGARRTPPAAARRRLIAAVLAGARRPGRRCGRSRLRRPTPWTSSSRDATCRPARCSSPDDLIARRVPADLVAAGGPHRRRRRPRAGRADRPRRAGDRRTPRRTRARRGPARADGRCRCGFPTPAWPPCCAPATRSTSTPPTPAPARRDSSRATSRSSPRRRDVPEGPPAGRVGRWWWSACHRGGADAHRGVADSVPHGGAGPLASWPVAVHGASRGRARESA